MQSLAVRPLTVDEFLEWDSGDGGDYDLVDGEIVAMAPTKPPHQIMAVKLGRYMDEALDDRPGCTVRAEAPVVPPDRADTCHIADLAATCRPYEPGQVETPDPIVIVEILSPATENHDRTVKVPDYRAIPSVQEIVLLDQQKLYCEVHRRLDDARWLTDLLRQPADRLRLDSIGLDVPLSAIYVHLAAE